MKHKIREFVIGLLLSAIAGAFMAWLIINLLTGCCEGGVCVPESFYPQCKQTNRNGSINNAK